MFHAHSTLIQAALVLGIDPHLVGVVGETVSSQVSRMTFGSVKTEVLHESTDGDLISATFEPEGMDFCFRTKLMEPDYSTLADIIDSVVNEKIYSAPWVTNAVAKKLSNVVTFDSVLIYSRDIVTARFSDTDINGFDHTSMIDIVATVGNKPYSYCYAVYDENNQVILDITNEESLDRLVTRLATGIGHHYNEWRKSHDNDSPKPITDGKAALSDVFKAVDERHKQHPDDDVEVIFSNPQSFAVHKKSSNTGFFVTYDEYTQELLVYKYKGESSDVPCYKQFLRVDKLGKAEKDRTACQLLGVDY